MSTEVQEFDPRKFADEIKDKVKNIVVSNMPDAAFEQMIKKEFDDFFVDKISGNNWNSETKKSPFKQMVADELQVFFKKKMGEYIDKNCTDIWENGSRKVMSTLVAELAPFVMQKFTENMVQQTVIQIQNNTARY